jgi:hypothetical protein
MALRLPAEATARARLYKLRRYYCIAALVGDEAMSFGAIRGFFAPPVFPGDAHATRRGQALNTSLLVTMALVLLLIAGNLAGGRIPLVVNGVDFAIFGACLLLRRWVWQGRIGLAGGGLLAVGFVALTVVIALIGTTCAASN